MKNRLTEYYKSKAASAFNNSIVIWVVYSVLLLILKNFISNLVPAADKFQYHEIVSFALTTVLGTVGATTVTKYGYKRYLKYVNEKGWKKKFPEYDLSGEWMETTSYNDVITSQSPGSAGRTLSSKVIIEQDCNHISIKNSPGPHFTWYSITADIGEDDCLNILYKVEYIHQVQRDFNYPEDRVGYERMHVVKWGPDGRPTRMEGTYRHCVSNDGKPSFTGSVEYVRVDS